MTTSSCAGNMSATHRKDLGIQMLSGTESVSHLAARQGVSRKFAYRQACKADAALTEAFTPCVKDDDVLFYIPVTKAWLKQLTLALILICHSSYRGVVELLRDLLDVTICAGTVHNWLHEAAGQAVAHNRAQNLSAIRVGLHNEIFQGSQPIRVSVDAASTYCYILAGEKHRDAHTWGVHLLEACAQGFNPDYTIADAGAGLRAGQREAMGDKPCHGDVFHIQHQCETMANLPARIAQGTTTQRERLDLKIAQAKQPEKKEALAPLRAIAHQAGQQALSLARDMR